MGPTATVFWLWLVAPSSSQVIPIPYEDKAVCEAAGEATDRYYRCVEQPTKDILNFNNSTGRGVNPYDRPFGKP